MQKLPIIDQGICLHWLWLSPNHLKEYFPVPANDDRVIINGRVLFHIDVNALKEEICRNNHIKR